MNSWLLEKEKERKNVHSTTAANVSLMNMENKVYSPSHVKLAILDSFQIVAENKAALTLAMACPNSSSLKNGTQGAQGGNLLQRVKIEAGKQAWLALPVLGFNVVQFGVQLVSVASVGHLGKLQLSSAALAISFCNVTGYSFILGLAFALDTLCGQAYGAKQYSWLGIYMQRAILVLCIIAVPISVMWFNMEHVLLFFHQAPDISMKAGIYARWLIPGLFAHAFLQPLFKFLQAQSKVLPMFLCSCMALLLHVLLCWMFIYKLRMGNTGAALATSLTNWLNALLLVCVAVVTPECKQCWPGISRKAFQDIEQFLKLAIPSAVMICLEWWAAEALVLFSGVLPNPQLETSVFSIVFNVIELCCVPLVGISVAVSVRTSNELGAGQPVAAQFAFYVSMFISAVSAIALGSILLLSRNILGPAFSSDPEVSSYVTRMMPLVLCYAILGPFQAAVSGVAGGCGRQAVAAFVNIGAYYIVGLPIGLVLALVYRLQGEGLLIGSLCGYLTQTIGMVIVSGITNWTKQAQAALDRTSASMSSPLLV